MVTLSEDDNVTILYNQRIFCGLENRDGGGWINAGFIVLSPQIFQYIEAKGNEMFERGSSEKLKAYKHDGFWHCMDTMRGKIVLNDL